MNGPALSRSGRPWYAQAATLVYAHWPVKFAGTTLFIALFFAAYFYLLSNPAYPPTTMPVLWLDRQIGLQPLALPLYLSLWLYVSLAPALLATPRELFAHARAMTAMCLAGLVVFYFWPTTIPVAASGWAMPADFLKSIDAAGNACPSLHVATAVFSGAWLARALRGIDAPRAIRVANALWCAGIVYSTLATRQHVVLDVLGGLALGTLAAWLSLRGHDAACADWAAKASDSC